MKVTIVVKVLKDVIVSINFVMVDMIMMEVVIEIIKVVINIVNEKEEHYFVNCLMKMVVNQKVNTGKTKEEND